MRIYTLFRVLEALLMNTNPSKFTDPAERMRPHAMGADGRARAERGLTLAVVRVWQAAMCYRNSKAFERFTMRMLLVIGVGTAANLGYLMHLKSTGEFVPLELERRGYERAKREDR